MSHSTGANAKDIKMQNRLLVLRLIATGHGVSRVEISKATGLAKMTVGNIVNELVAGGVVEEAESTGSSSGGYGRKPILLRIARTSPCICGALVKRGLIQVVLATLDGHIFERLDFPFAQLDSADDLVQKLQTGFDTLHARAAGRIIALGISSVGPVDTEQGVILTPPFFYGIENLPIASMMQQYTGLPTFLINDANAGALAENLYGAGKLYPDFVYLHIMNGIGAGFILGGKLHNGTTGQSGEIGHTSINFSGPPCSCGNIGCLDLYASVEHMRQHIQNMAPLYPQSALGTMEHPRWLDIVDAGNGYDPLAIAALDEFCTYISHALVNVMNILDVSTIIVGYASGRPGDIVETLLQRKIASTVLFSRHKKITVEHSLFGGDAPLVGAIADVANKVFTQLLPLDGTVLPNADRLLK